jgi:hypothetical protein
MAEDHEFNINNELIRERNRPGIADGFRPSQAQIGGAR